LVLIRPWVLATSLITCVSFGPQSYNRGLASNRPSARTPMPRQPHDPAIAHVPAQPAGRRSTPVNPEIKINQLAATVTIAARARAVLECAVRRHNARTIGGNRRQRLLAVRSRRVAVVAPVPFCEGGTNPSRKGWGEFLWKVRAFQMTRSFISLKS